MDEFRQRVQAWVNENIEEMVSTVQDFARIRSVSRADLAQDGAPFGEECRKMLTYALERANEMGFETHDYEGYCGSASIGDDENAIGIIAHLDVVPEGDKWVYPPYEATRVGNFLIGRGVSDNKSAAVMGLFLMKMFREMGIELKYGIKVMMGCAEETGMEDMSYFVKNYPAPVLSLIPDSSFPVNFAQKGSMRGYMSIPTGEQIISFTGGEVRNMVPPHATVKLKGIKASQLNFDDEFTITDTDFGCEIVAHGIASHAAHPEGGKSAINMMAVALADSGVLAGQSLETAKAIRDMTCDYYGANCGIAAEDPDTGKTTMVVGVAKMKDGEIYLSLDCRLSLAADPKENIESFKKYCAEHGFGAHDMGYTKPVYMPKDDEKIVLLSNVYAEITGEYREPYSMGGGTYARVLPNAITFGPGFPDAKHERPELPENHGGAHGPDEFMSINMLKRAFEVYACALKALDEVI